MPPFLHRICLVKENIDLYFLHLLAPRLARLAWLALRGLATASVTIVLIVVDGIAKEPDSVSL
jgi:hypothetical protein